MINKKTERAVWFKNYLIATLLFYSAFIGYYFDNFYDLIVSLMFNNISNYNFIYDLIFLFILGAILGLIASFSEYVIYRLFKKLGFAYHNRYLRLIVVLICFTGVFYGYSWVWWHYMTE